MVESKAQVFGHPLHPMLMVFPIALYPVALVADIVWIWRGDALWLSIAFWTLVLAVVGNVAAGIPGLVDYARVVPKTGEVRKTAKRHMVMGFALLFLGLASLALRWAAGAYTTGDVAGKAVDASLVWAAIAINLLLNLGVVAQGWWGGELVYDHHIGVHPRRFGAGGEPATGVPVTDRDASDEDRLPRPGGGPH